MSPKGSFNLLQTPNMTVRGNPRWYQVTSVPSCQKTTKPFEIYNILQYRSNEKVIKDGANAFSDNGIGVFIKGWNATTAFLGGEKIQFSSGSGGDNKFYKVLSNTAAAESPITHPGKFALFTPSTSSLGLITDSHDPFSFRIGSTFRNLHTENFIVLNNQAETDFFKKNRTNTFDTVHNLGTTDIFRNPKDVAKTEIKLFDDSGSSVLMEYLMIHFRKKRCQNGWLFIEIDEPEIPETIQNDHLLYFWIWEGDVNQEDGNGVNVTIDNQFNQNVQEDKVGTTNPDINVLSNSHSETGASVNPIRIQAAMRLSEIKSGNDDKKLIVGLNTPVFTGKQTFYTILIGLRPCDLKHKEKVENIIHPDDVPIGGIGSEQIQCTNPDVGNITLKISNYRVIVEKNTSKRWDDRPIPSHVDGAMNAAGLIGKGVEGDNQLLVLTYQPYELKANNDFIDFPSQTADKFGLPNRLKGSDANDFRAIVRARTPRLNPVSKLGFGFEHFPENKNLATDGNKLIDSVQSGPAGESLGAFGGLGIFHRGLENIPGNNSYHNGSIKMIGAFKKEFFGTLNDWILRLPQIDVAAHGLATYGAGSSTWVHTGWASKSSFKIGIYRADNLNIDLDNRINIRELRTNMTLIQEFSIGSLYSDDHAANNDPVDFAGLGDQFSVKAHYKVFTIVDFQRYINVNLNTGDDPNEPIAYFWLVFGSKSNSSGFFFADRLDTSNQTFDNTANEPSFPYFEVFAIMRHLNSSLVLFNPAATGTVIDFGTMLFKSPRFIDLDVDATPRDYVYTEDPNIDPF